MNTRVSKKFWRLMVPFRRWFLKKIKLIVLVAFIISTITTVFTIIYGPYIAYRIVLAFGIDSKYLVLASDDDYKYGIPHVSKMPETISISGVMESSSLWTLIQYANFEVTLPWKNPQVQVVPMFPSQFVKGDSVFGMRITDYNKKELFSFMQFSPRKFHLPIKEHLLFNLPIFRNYILAHKENEIWKDLYSKDIYTLNGNSGIVSLIRDIWGISLKELVYNLFLQRLRQNMFPDGKITFSWWKNKQVGVLVLAGQSNKILSEILFFLQNGVIYPISLTTKVDVLVADVIRERFLSTISFKETNLDAATYNYEKYKNLEYADRVGEAGMLYLLGAWSHDPDNREFFRELVVYLERGQDTLDILKPIYKYSFMRFGSTYSSRSNNLEETQEERLKRLMDEEMQRDIELSKVKKNIEVESDFSSADKKIDYFLKEAKETKYKEEDVDSVLLN